MKKKTKIIVCILTLIVFIPYLFFSKIEKKSLTNYLDISGCYNEIAFLSNGEFTPNEIVEYVTDDHVWQIYLYDDWYDVYNFVEEKDYSFFAYRVLTSDIYKLGPFNICIGTNRNKVDFFFSHTTKNQYPEKIIIFDDEGIAEESLVYLYCRSIPLTYGQIGFIFENDLVKNIIYYPVG